MGYTNGVQNETNSNSNNAPNTNQNEPNGARVGWQFALLPQQLSTINPMFGHGGYLPPDAYIRRPNYGEQGMVDVPHATPQSADNPNNGDIVSTNNLNNNQRFNAIITGPPINGNQNGSIPPNTTSVNELDIEHGLN